jgi:hypothetical protein
MDRVTFPPPNGPEHPQDPGLVGSARPTPSPTYQQLIRPHSDHNAPSRSTHPIPPWSENLPRGKERSHMNEALGSPDVKLTFLPIGIVVKLNCVLALVMGKFDP